MSEVRGAPASREKNSLNLYNSNNFNWLILMIEAFLNRYKIVGT